MTDESNSLAASALAESHCVLRPLFIMFARIFFDKKNGKLLASYVFYS